MSDHRSHLDWMTKLGNWNLAKIFWGWVEKVQIFQLTFCVGAVRRLPLIFILTLPRPHCLGHIPLFALTSISPKKCGFIRPAVYCRQAFAFSLRHLISCVCLYFLLNELCFSFWSSGILYLCWCLFLCVPRHLFVNCMFVSSIHSCMCCYQYDASHPPSLPCSGALEFCFCVDAFCSVFLCYL